MIKKLFITQSIFFYIVANSQVLTYVGDAALVTIQPQTLVYNGGGLQTAGSSVVNNSGNVMLKGVSTGAATDDILTIGSSSRFNLKFANSASYGQLYVTGIKQGQISGLVNKEYQADYLMGATASQQIGLPFYNFTIDQLVSVFGAGNLNVTNTANNSSGRFAPNSAFWWNNARARFDQIAYGGTAYSAAGVPNPSFISPMTYYIIPRRKADGSYFWAPTTEVKTFAGVPASDVIEAGTINNVSFSLSGGYSGSFGTNGNASNFFGEKYYSYLNDPFRTKSTPWPDDYAKNLYQLANPFLTNVDLRFIARTDETGSDGNFISNLEGIAYYGSNSLGWTNIPGQTGNGTSYDSGNIIIFKKVGTIFQVGDVSNTIIKPMGAFLLKLSTPAAASLNFNDTRRFKQTSRDAATPYSVTAAKSSGTDVDVPADKIVKQVAVVMLDADGFEIDRTYYAVSPTAITGYNPTSTLLQAYSESASKKIFTKEEKPTGGLDYNYNDNLYINEANEIDFKGKEIPLYINYSSPYQLKFEVYEMGERVNDTGLSNGNSFYIKDNQNQVVKIVDGATMALSGSQNIGLYYEKPSNTTLGTDIANGSVTIIAKKDNKWVVRFAKNWKNATVEVYSSAGQLLSSKSKVSTTSDYLIPVNEEVKSVFVVKVTSETGEVVVKKIVN